MVAFEPEKYEIMKISFQCHCQKMHSFEVDEGNLADNPYVDVSCSCGTYFKRRGDIEKNGGKQVDIQGTGVFL